jgi:hypothetical protein
VTVCSVQLTSSFEWYGKVGDEEDRELVRQVFIYYSKLNNVIYTKLNRELVRQVFIYYSKLNNVIYTKLNRELVQQVRAIVVNVLLIGC